MAKTFFQQSPVQVGPGTLFSPQIDTSDFENAAKVILEMADYYADTAIPLEAAKRIARDDMDERFQTETAPDGSTWRKLSEGHSMWEDSYAKKKVQKRVRKVGRGDELFGGFIHPILTLEGELHQKAVSEAAWSVSGNSVWFNTGALPFYWAPHQDPMDHGRGDDLPQRQFIGLSAEAEDKVIAEVEAWIALGMSRAETHYKTSHFGIGSSYGGGVITGIGRGSHGAAQYRVSGPGFGGRFGPKA